MARRTLRITLPGLLWALAALCLLTAAGLAGWVRDPEAREKYVEAFGRSDFEAMLSYYKQNYPKGPYLVRYEELKKQLPPKVKVPVLMFHGLEDRALNARALNNTWEWLEEELTLVTIPGAGHFVQSDAAERVTETMKWWLSR